MHLFLEKLQLVAHEPLTYVAFVVLVGAWLWRAYFLRTKDYLGTLKTLPERDQLGALQLLALGYPQKVTANHLKLLQQRYFFLAFVATLVSLIILSGLLIHFWSLPAGDVKELLTGIAEQNDNASVMLAQLSLRLKDLEDHMNRIELLAARYKNEVRGSAEPPVPSHELVELTTTANSEVASLKEQLAAYEQKYGPLQGSAVRDQLIQAGQKVQATERLFSTSFTLKNAFIQRYKDRVSVESSFRVDTVGKPLPPRISGNVNIAGRDETLGFVVEARIMNARDEQTAIAVLRDARGTDRPISLAGVWRLWMNHPGSEPFVQGGPLQRAISSNPDHIFEIHPVTRANGVDTLKSIRPMPGFEPKDAEKAFGSYEKLECRIAKQENTTTISTFRAGYNYPQFVLEALGSASEIEDGWLLLANVRSLDGKLLVERVRMVFVKGSQPAESVNELKAGGRLSVLGMPRINLNAVEVLSKSGGLVRGKLPYEMVILGVFAGNEA